LIKKKNEPVILFRKVIFFKIRIKETKSLKKQKLSLKTLEGESKVKGKERSVSPRRSPRRNDQFRSRSPIRNRS
jgi:hypothetical protein